MFEGLLLPWQQIYHLAFLVSFRTTPEVSSKLYFVEICQDSEKLWLFNHKRADFWLPNFGFKRSLLNLLNLLQLETDHLILGGGGGGGRGVIEFLQKIILPSQSSGKII